ncbi:transposase [Streptomyces sp. NPDC016734]|uniref:transposase n=1 Tax=Streptomyces TaxID=1883 RepID=UPI00099C8AD3
MVRHYLDESIASGRSSQSSTPGLPRCQPSGSRTSTTSTPSGRWAARRRGHHGRDPRQHDPVRPAQHLASWIGLRPGQNESAGVNRSGRTRPGNSNIKRLGRAPGQHRS